MKFALVVIMAALAGTAAAQGQKPAVKADAAVVSEPGRAAVVAVAEITATVVAIDKATRGLTLKGPKRTVDVVAGDEVKNFDQIKVGDRLVVKYVEALTLELKKTKDKPGAKGEVAAVRAAPGARPAGAVGREITVLADVVAVDPKKSVISLKGAARQRGRPQRAESGPFQGGQGRRPGRGGVHRGARRGGDAGAEGRSEGQGRGQEEIGRSHPGDLSSPRVGRGLGPPDARRST
jgi:hypothetical protein